ncbi:hypothetical protein HK102_000708 [Quaeritorhiza haematococci]|nr:hypothetical protein HK102_000708 [Quaeritorhiza haematococci]
MVIASQLLRVLGMMTAGSNFKHMIAETKSRDHQLVTNGVYSIFRHPAYTGFFYWGIGLQLMMMNPICLVGYALALHRFFSSRIAYEEGLLIRFFGKEYEAYRKRTVTLIPNVP